MLSLFVKGLQLLLLTTYFLFPSIEAYDLEQANIGEYLSGAAYC
jgi:hypothetical protein